MRILGVDDNTDITKLLNTILSSEGHEFSSVDNGREGLKRMREQSYDLIFLDLSMPGFSGLDVVEELVKDGNINKQKIVLFTASSVSDVEINNLIKKGVHSCLRKPVDIDAVLDKVSQFQ